MTLKKWITARDLSGIAGLPKNPSSVARKAKSENWEHRQIEGIKGVAYEFNVYSLPVQIREQVINHLDLPKDEPSSTATEPSLIQEDKSFEALWKTIPHLINEQEKSEIVRIFKWGGLTALMPTVCNNLKHIQGDGEQIESVLSGSTDKHPQSAATQEGPLIRKKAL
ncbi:DNA-binding protein [Serratia marcescens]|uniref:DNA-binding protein n=1 Tax=Serratia marcescens TaxID=615 RepID=UPI00275A5B2B|nr:DNA-binding protein [Serratia marcescens]MDP8833897.1 DNA-binding protein [Serratia marcescens]